MGGILVGLGMVALSIMSVSTSQSGPPTTAGVQQAQWNSVGSPDAPVTLTEWIDFQCPACRAFALTREPAIKQKYVESGRVRIVYQNLAFLGPESTAAAEAAQCAADQGRYLDFHQALFQRQRGENTGAFTRGNLEQIAQSLGLNQSQFDRCLDQGTHHDAVLAEAKAGDSEGIKATPTLLLNGRRLDGIPTVEALSRLIDEELAKK